KFSREDLLPIFQRFEFTSLLKRLPEIVEDAPKVMRTARKLIAAVREFGADDVVKIFADADQVAVIPSVVGRPWNGVFHGLALAVSKNGAVHEAGFVRGASAKVFKALKNFKGELIGHDLKSLIAWTPCDGAEWNVKLFDTMIASYLLHPGTRTHDLRSILLQVLGVESATSIEEKQPGLFGPDFKAVAIDAQHLLTVAENFRAELEDKSLAHLFDEIEMPLTAVLAQMEKWGVALDTPRLNKLSGESVLRIEEIAAKMYKYAGGEFNIASPLQLRDILYEKLGLGRMSQGKMIVKKGKTGLSTAASELEKLRGEHPIIELLEEHRELSKLQSTYLEVLPGLVDKKTGRVHTSFNQAVTATGRLSSSDPNLQNIPVRTELGRAVRTAFVATRGYDLLSADYSQIELRIAASLSNDEKMIAIFKEGEDIHKRTAAEINGVPLNQVTKEMRYGAKEINFGVLYGMGVFGLASRTGITHDEARSFIEKYFATFPGLQRYIVETKALAEQLGYVETMFGRRRYIPEMKSANVQMRNAGERMAVNHPIQGTAADMIKMAMIAVARYILKTHGDGEDAPVKMILQVHDELIFEVKHGLTKELAAAVRRIMSGVVKLKVPMVVNVSVGSNWGELEELSEHD
ncbi:MAG: DNA polymerase I, partial [Candidatus Magasanikbacteria bacterium]|nr:DNA polymerase I [Candidatus Magasanikbacteria bacterium]